MKTPYCCSATAELVTNGIFMAAYSMALIGKQRGDGLEDFYEAISHANDATVTFTYSSPATDVLRVSINTDRATGILYRVTIKISH